MFNSLIFTSVISVIVAILVGAFTVVTIKSFYSREKFSTFECGMDLMNNLRLPFSLHFYMVSIIFLIFDVELMLILPLIYCFKYYEIKTNMILIIMLFLVLIIGFIYEWWTGLLDWML